MMMLSHDDLMTWLDTLLKDRILIAPRDVGRNHVHYRPVSSSSEITLNYTRPDLSAKEFLFPHTERLMRITKHGREVSIENYFLEKEQVIFGLRPCDAHGLLAFDALFRDKEPADRHYIQRREMTTLVGMACPQMWDHCFCTSFGAGPDDPAHLDVLLTGIDGNYAVQAVTDKGKELLESANLYQDNDATLPEIPLNDRVPIPLAEQWPAHFNDSYWMQLGERCLSCKLCTFICPTCRCFDLRDEPVASGANLVIHERMRVWDACTAPNYRTIAGGHNSRPNKGQRIRNRYYCKFYYYPQDFGPLGCVGCGRCIDACPVNIDIIEMLGHVNQLLSAGEKKEAT
ncbi:MAG: 4Fe-4S dicluster domain-containing protein [Anaerolineales bacterium]|nr:4Fe-4S dicluster domain-containing protein [Anaerolineales bacterium]